MYLDESLLCKAFAERDSDVAIEKALAVLTNFLLFKYVEYGVISEGKIFFIKIKLYTKILTLINYHKVTSFI